MLKPTSRPTRRKVLKRGLLGGAVLALGAVGLALRPGQSEAPPVEPLRVLSLREYAVVCALARRFVPAPAGAPSADQLQVASAADRILSMADASAQREVRQLLTLFENALPNLLFGGRVQPFTRQTAQEQDETLAQWQGSRLAVRRTGFMALRALVLAAYYGNPKSWGAAGYPGPPAGFHQPDAPVWVGGGPRPGGNGVWHPEGG